MSRSIERADIPIPARGFEVAEFERRTARAQAKMAEASVDALLLTTEPELHYFAGFHTAFWQSPTRPWFLILPIAGKPVAVIPDIGKASMSRTWVSDIRIWPAPQPEDDGISLLIDTLKELAGGPGRIGMPMGHETHIRMPLNDFERLRKGLPGFSFADAAHIVRSLRMVKSEAEIDKIRYVCHLVCDAFDNLPGLIRVGDSERGVFRKFTIDLLERGVDAVPYLVGSSGPGGFDDVIKKPTDRLFEPGDMLLLDTGSTFDGYYSDFDRNVAFGFATDEAKGAYETVYRATEAGLAATRPGTTTSEVWRAMAEVLEAGGSMGNVVGRLGHGLGLQVTEWPSNMPGDDTLIEPGMVLTLEPGMLFAPGKMMLHEENLVVREDGPELLSRRAWPELPIIS